MIDLKMSNYLVCLSYLHSGVGSYHRGYIEEMGVNQDNVFNGDLDVDKIFPSLIWLPCEGEWDVKGGKNRMMMELRLFDVLNVDELGELNLDTKNLYWDRLNVVLYQILRELRKGDFGDGMKVFDIGRVEYYNDVDVAENVLIYVGVKFDVDYRIGCDDFNFDYGSLPVGLNYPIEEVSDYETLNLG